MFDKIVISVCLLLVSTLLFAERIVTDPQQDYLDHKLSWLFKEDYIYTLTVDLNEDGVTDYFYSTLAKENIASRRGARTWTPYLSSPQGYQVADVADVTINNTHTLLTLNTATSSLQRLANGKLALMYLAIGTQGSGVNEAYYVDDNNRLQSLEISRLDNGQESERSVATTPVVVALQLVSDKAEPLSVLLEPEQYSQVKSKAEDFFADKRGLTDRRSSVLYYLYTKDLSEFLGLKEERRELLIPIEAIEEPIRTLLTKRALAHAKGIGLTSEQDKLELEKILKWFDDWHEQYGKSRLMSKKIRAMTAEERQQILDSIGMPASK